MSIQSLDAYIQSYADTYWGISITEVKTGTPVYKYNSKSLMLPASIVKLLTATAAFEYLGPDTRIKTSIYSRMRPDVQGILNGDLIVYGRGDPSFTSLQIPSRNNSLEVLAQHLFYAGLRVVTGDLVIDEHFLNTERCMPDCEYADLQYYYAPEISTIPVDRNTIRVTVTPNSINGYPCTVLIEPSYIDIQLINRSQTVEDTIRVDLSIQRVYGTNQLLITGNLNPACEPVVKLISVLEAVIQCAGSGFKKALEQVGISITGTIKVSNWLNEPLDTNVTQLYELTSVESPNIIYLVSEMLKVSDNLSAHLLGLQVGKAFQTRNQASKLIETVAASTDAYALEALNQLIYKWNLPRSEIHLRDTSGLSRQNLMTSNFLVHFLRQLTVQPYYEHVYNCLPIAGIKGTLRNRFKDSKGYNVIHATIGTLTHIGSLAGYIVIPKKSVFSFCVFLNNYVDSTNQGISAAQIIDKFIENVLKEI